MEDWAVGLDGWSGSPSEPIDAANNPESTTATSKIPMARLRLHRGPPLVGLWDAMSWSDMIGTRTLSLAGMGAAISGDL